jgi:hypothetical protein
MPTLPQEDIGSVLERFHKWAGKEPEPVRELSYEEAVKRSRRHVYADEEPVHSEPVKAAPRPEEPIPTATKTKAAKPAPTSNGQPARKTADAAKPGRSGSGKSTGKTARKAASKPVQKVSSTAARGSARPATANPMSASQPSAASAYQAVCQAAAELVPPPAPAPSFEQVLAAQIHPPASPLALRADTHPVTPLASDAPAVHLTVRLAVEERNAVRERAHDLGITPAAYMRHCILEIDSLRAELESARLAYAQTPLPALAAESADSVAFEGGTALSLRQPARQNHPADGSWLTRLLRILLPGRTNHRELSIGA